MFERLPERVNAHAGLVRRGRFLTVTFLVQRGESQYLVRVVEGRVTGEYDFSCTPADSARTADAIKGAKFTAMKGLGHFPMSEHPAQFRTYLRPVLDEIRAHPRRS